MRFTKMHGIGNDYIYFNCFEEKIDNPEALSVLLSDRHKGIGGDGIVLICQSDCADFKMRIFNADGSEAKMCGNATRCIGKYVYDRGMTNSETVTLETLSGIKTLKLKIADNAVSLVTVDMGIPVTRPTDIPMKAEGDSFINRPITVDGVEYRGTAVSMGNPHFVVFTSRVRELPLERLGPLFENHPLFPDRVNTEFAELDDDGIFMRVWERGSGETMACGTGASAVFTAAMLNGISGSRCEIGLLGGNLSFEMNDGHVFMTGPAEFVCDGTVAPSLLSKID